MKAPIIHNRNEMITLDIYIDLLPWRPEHRIDQKWAVVVDVRVSEGTAKNMQDVGLWRWHIAPIRISYIWGVLFLPVHTTDFQACNLIELLQVVEESLLCRVEC